ncbi:MAG: hypothetical protein J5756_04520 [Clostridia bacterium]|nr:hypothetical protein [Clostridia bacterium]
MVHITITDHRGKVTEIDTNMALVATAENEVCVGRCDTIELLSVVTRAEQIIRNIRNANPLIDEAFKNGIVEDALNNSKAAEQSRKAYKQRNIRVKPAKTPKS